MCLNTSTELSIRWFERGSSEFTFARQHACRLPFGGGVLTVDGSVNVGGPSGTARAVHRCSPTTSVFYQLTADALFKAAAP
jgi:hypothetical protein